MKTLRNALLLTVVYVVLLLGIHFLHVRFFSVDVVFYAAIGDALLAAVLTGLLLLLPALRRFTVTEKVLLVAVWLLGGYSFAISVPTVIDRSLSFYILEKLDQRGGGIRQDAFQDVFTKEYMVEHRLVDVRCAGFSWLEYQQALRDENVDVAVARRRSRVETLRFRAFYVVYKFIFQLLTGRTISFGNFMAIKVGALHRLNAMHEVWTHVAAGLIASKLRLAVCPIDRGPRYAGQSKMNFVGLTLHGFRALMVFAEDVLVRVGLMCVLVSSASIVLAVVATLLKLAGYATPGWFSMALGVLFLVFLQTGTLTLMTLMLSGIVRGTIQKPGAYREYLAGVTEVTADVAPR